MTHDPRLLVTIRSAEKTILLNTIWDDCDSLHEVVIVSDMAQAITDLIHAEGSLSRADETVLAMSNGCICSTVHEDLLVEMRCQALAERFDYLLVKLTGISEALPIPTIFEFQAEDGARLSDTARLDTMVPVADAVNLTTDLSNHDFLSDQREMVSDGNADTLDDLPTNQIEFDDGITLKKSANTGPARVDAAGKIICTVNENTRVNEADHNRVAPRDILNADLSDFYCSHSRQLWAKELFCVADHTFDTKEHDIASFVYRARQPFEPRKIYEFLNSPLPGVIRAKGHFWIATRPDWLAGFSLAGMRCSIRSLGQWWASLPFEQWPNHPRGRTYLDQHWAEPFGDRRQEMIFICAALDEDRLRARLDACLLGEEWGDAPQAWAKLPDPFPAWPRIEEAAA